MTESSAPGTEWPYPLQRKEERQIRTEVLVLGGGIAGCWAALAAARGIAARRKDDPAVKSLQEYHADIR